MEKGFLKYEQALELKELGFNEPCFGYCRNNQFEFFSDVRSCNTNSEFRFYPTAPSFSQAFRWFREEYNLQHEITRQGTNYWLLTILEIDKVTINGIFNGKKYDLDDYIKNEPRTYEEAELECLKKLIEIVKNNKDV